MNRFHLCYLSIAIAWLYVSSPNAEATTCWVVAVAMNQDGKHSEDWNQFGEETALLFSTQASELYDKVLTKTVLGRDATLPAIKEAVRWAFLNARRSDLVVVHISCHGGTAPRDGWSVDTMDGQLMYGRDLKSAAANVPCPVLFLIDTCESGGFARPHARDIALPENCAALCSSRSRQSTTNVLNISMNEAFWGAGDRNDNGFVELSEVVAYIETRAKKVAEKAETMKDSEMPVMVVGSGIPADLKLTKTSDQLVAILHDRQWHLARVKSEAEDKVQVHVMGYQDDPEKDYFLVNEVPKRRVFKLDSGEVPVFVTEGDNSKPALAVKWQRSAVTVRFPSSPRADDKIVERSAVKLPFPFLQQKSDRE